MEEALEAVYILTIWIILKEIQVWCPQESQKEQINMEKRFTTYNLCHIQ